MKLTILLFGRLTDIAGSSQLLMDWVADTNGLVKELHRAYPDLIDSKYVIAVDQKVIATNTPLSEHSSVALLPPFSGG